MRVFFPGGKQVFAEVNGFTVKTDQHPQSGGNGEFPEPFTLFLASLGTCAGIYVKYFCDQRMIDASEFELTQEIQYDQVKRRIGTFLINIHVPASFPEKYDEALIRSASQCAVKKHIDPEIELLVKVLRDR